MNIWYGSNENAWLSNLASRPFKYMDRHYISVEHAYQCNKSDRFDEQTYIKPWAAGKKYVGRYRVDTTNDFNLHLMHELITLSFVQNPVERDQLKSLHNEPLTHNQDRGIWKTKFPEILMDVIYKLNNVGGNSDDVGTTKSG